jgi:endonuclease G
MIRILIFLSVILMPLSCDSDQGVYDTGNLKTGTRWMELPSMNDSSVDYYTHSFVYKRKTYRNYSFAWSQDDLVSLWVAYPLCPMYTDKGVDRTEAWSYDPLLGEESSPAPFKGYAGDYARGHQIPSADRMCCKKANEQTFYGTNIVPQLNEHNDGIWNRLESYVRNVAEKSDTIYVVTGCVVDGSKKKTEDSDGKTITVPLAYFKALLRYDKDSEMSQWAGAAFYTEHKNYGKDPDSFKSVAMSIDELEKRTGMDFFVNLPAEIGDANAAYIEAQNPADSGLWW